MISPWYLWFVLTAFSLVCTNAQLSNNKDDLLNWCLDSVNHKHKPGKEDDLHLQCVPWRDHACCTADVTVDLHETDLYNFTLDHCYDQLHVKMSKECRRHFNQNNCFYECEPNIGLWVVKTTRQIASERFYKVPLCASDCETWFNACKDDYTCAYNWPRDFKFSKGHNSCRKNSTCQKFEQVYLSAKDFCENVWDHSWKYVPDAEPCMRIWFNSSVGNPNRKVAEYFISERFPGAGTRNIISLWVLFVGIFLNFSRYL
ncbi:folate receptor gamma-like [Uloborus diversus]|uniref:folate receptor gamma-like n=1 Tax=Uloborus diversus TaxID=327109 RepID=UPI002409D55B|nr:folate receptor gamma-like [Uloborus diversus]